MLTSKEKKNLVEKAIKEQTRNFHLVMQYIIRVKTEYIHPDNYKATEEESSINLTEFIQELNKNFDKKTKMSIIEYLMDKEGTL